MAEENTQSPGDETRRAALVVAVSTLLGPDASTAARPSR